MYVNGIDRVSERVSLEEGANVTAKQGLTKNQVHNGGDEINCE